MASLGYIDTFYWVNLINQHWLRQWLVANRQQAITWANVDHRYMSPYGVIRPQWVDHNPGRVEWPDMQSNLSVPLIQECLVSSGSLPITTCNELIMSLKFAWKGLRISTCSPTMHCTKCRHFYVSHDIVVPLWCHTDFGVIKLSQNMNLISVNWTNCNMFVIKICLLILSEFDRVQSNYARNSFLDDLGIHLR